MRQAGAGQGLTLRAAVHLRSASAEHRLASNLGHLLMPECRLSNSCKSISGPATMSIVKDEFVYLWEYRVKDTAVAEFEKIYGPHGAWAKLFGRSQGYLRTELIADQDQPGRYVTIDRWVSRQSRDRFREEFAIPFQHLDLECEQLTSMERFLGDFEVVRNSDLEES